MRKGWRCVRVWKGHVCMCIVCFGCMLGEGWGVSVVGGWGRGGRARWCNILWWCMCMGKCWSWIHVVLSVCVCVCVCVCTYVVLYGDGTCLLFPPPHCVPMWWWLPCCVSSSWLQSDLQWRGAWGLAGSFGTCAGCSDHLLPASPQSRHTQVMLDERPTLRRSPTLRVAKHSGNVCSDHLLLKSWHTQVTQDVPVICCQSHDILRVNLDTQIIYH